MLNLANKGSITVLTNDLNEIKNIIVGDDTLKNLFALTTSIPSIGLVASDEMKAIIDSKKISSHAGVTPFK